MGQPLFVVFRLVRFSINLPHIKRVIRPAEKLRQPHRASKAMKIFLAPVLILFHCLSKNIKISAILQLIYYYLESWILQQIIMYSNKVKLVAG